MNTPAHMVASILVWRHEEKWPVVGAAVFGAWLPDLSMFFFVVIERLRGASFKTIFDELYFEAYWQLIFDYFNSIPLALLVVGIGVAIKKKWVWVLGASAALHMVCDLPLHHDDAHRHFLPLTNFRWQSPLSYWDPNHFGWIIAPVEAIFAVGSSVFLVIKSSSTPIRICAAVVLSMYLFVLCAAVVAAVVR